MQSTTVIAANRFGFGARPGELADIDRDPRGWLLEQLEGPAPTPAALEGLPKTADVLVEVQNLRRERQQARRASAAKPSTDSGPGADRAPTSSSGSANASGRGNTDPNAPAPDIVRKYGRTVRQHYVQQTQARYRAAAASDQPFRERLVHFWSNHFAVSIDKQPLPAIAGLYENEAIRPHVTGTFAELLIAAEQHPAMILYLDNQRSIGPESKLARMAARRRPDLDLGLNENLAREILELHTLGVDGGYTQTDVTTFAKVITGWSIGGANPNGRLAAGKPGTFAFRENIHEPGAQTLLGKRYAEDGIDQGLAVLHDLAVHPATAHHIATQLARHFVADAPPPKLVDKLTRTFLETGGDLTAVYTALVDAPEAWTDLHAKYKSPNDFVISTFRAFDRVPDNARFVVAALDLMGQTPFRPGSPAGWPDTAEQWGGADALYKRIEWCNTVARVVGTRANPVELGEAVLGPAFSDATREAIARADSEVQGMTLLLASPDFQRR